MNRNLRDSLAGGRSIPLPAASQHRRGRSLPGITKDSDENPVLFSGNRPTLSANSSDESSDVSVKSTRLSLQSIKLARSGGGVYDLLSSTDGAKHDYDWLLTPPATPLGIISLSPPITTSLASFTSSPKASRPLVSHTESNRSSKPTRSSSVTAPSISASQHSTYSSTRSSTNLNATSASVSSYIRPMSPLTRSPSTPRPSTPSSRSTLSRPSTPSKVRRQATRSSSIEKARPSSTPNSRSKISVNPSGASTRSNSRPSTPTRRNTVASISVSTSAGRIFSASTSRPSSAGPRTRTPLQPVVPPDSAPTNLRTNLPGRSVSAGRSKPGVTSTTMGTAEATSNLNSQRRNPSPIVTKGRLTEPSGKCHPNGNGHLADRPDSRKASHVLDIATQKHGKASTGVIESTGFGRTISKNLLDIATRHMDIRNGKGSSCPLSSTTLYPHSIRSTTSKIHSVSSLSGSESINSKGSLESNGGMSENGSNASRSMEKGNEAKDGRSLARLSQVDIYESTRYDTMFLKEDVKNTTWLHSIDDKSDQGPIFDDGFEPLPEPFGPL